VRDLTPDLDAIYAELQAYRADGGGDGPESVNQALYEARMREAPVELTGRVDSPDPLLFRRVRARGRWMAERQAFVDNQVHDGKAGFEVMTPLKLANGDGIVLVNRGWIARDAGYPQPPRVPVPDAPAQVTGIATVPSTRFVELSPQAITGSVFQNLTIERYRAWSGLPVLPVVILADDPAPGLVAATEQPDAGVAKHREYEFTWFLLAATAAVLWIALNLRRVR